MKNVVFAAHILEKSQLKSITSDVLIISLFKIEETKVSRKPSQFNIKIKVIIKH